MRRLCLLHAALSIAALSAMQPAFGQYVWVDERGVKQYSDMPPPSSVPKARILKDSGGIARTAPQPAAPDENGDQPSAKEKTPMTTAEKNADFQKRRAEQAEKEKKAAEQERLAAEKAKNCERALEYKRVLESGERISRVEKNGERAFMTDEQRARELGETRRVAQDCKQG